MMPVVGLDRCPSESSRQHKNGCSLHAERHLLLVMGFVQGRSAREGLVCRREISEEYHGLTKQVLAMLIVDLILQDEQGK